MNSSNELEIIAKDTLRHLPAEAAQRRASGTLEHSLVALALVGLTMAFVWFQIDPVKFPRSETGMVILWSAVATGAVLIGFLQQLRTHRRANEIESNRLVHARNIYEMESHLLSIASIDSTFGSQDHQAAPEHVSGELEPQSATAYHQYVQVPAIISAAEEEEDVSYPTPMQEAVG